MAVELTCPTCGTVSHFDELSRDAIAFCRICDYPLFWVRSARLSSDDGAAGSVGLRRLPGTAGRIALATIDCPVCTEPNPVTSEICIRCGSLLRPPPPAPEPPPPPPPPPIPVVAPAAPVFVAHRRIWPWITAAILGAMALGVALYFAL